MSAGIILGNVTGLVLASITISPALIAQGTAAEQTFTVKGAKPGDAVFVNKPTTQAGLVIGNARVSAADTVAIEFGNIPSAGGNITPTASETYLLLVVRAESVQTSVPL